MHGDNIHMLLNSYTIIITFHTFFYLSPFLPIPYFSSITLSLLPTTFMSLNPMAQHHPQAWYWQPSVAPFHQSHHQHPCYLQVEHASEDQLIEREHMFEKPLTPSDVGKLNRLVIPKQHAERYFPLDGDSCDKGLLLCFEDESGKSWRFRYSYWTSSQSYVLTKGWSRFVKEKSLDAGDIVLFGRLRAGGDRLYIGCRRRGADESAATPARRAAAPWVSACYGAAGHSYPSNPDCPPYVPPSLVQQQYGHHAGEQREEVADSAATTTPTNSKRLIRLFGVNLDCGPVPETQHSLSSSSWFSEQL